MLQWTDIKQAPSVQPTPETALTTIVASRVRTIMTNDQYTVLRTEENGIEYFTVQETGESAVSVRGLAQMCGIPRNNLSRWLSNLSHFGTPEWLKSFADMDLYLSHEIKKKGKVIKPIRAEVSSKIISLAARHLKTEAAFDSMDAIAEIGLTHFVHAKTGYAGKVAAPQAQERISRILDAPNPWEKMFEVSFCRKVYSWMGGRFYWVYLYDFLAPEERCKHDRLNPIDPVTGKRDDRTHQYFDDQIRDRLYRHAQRVTDLVDTSTGFQDFATRFARFSGTNQLHLF